MLIYSMSVSVDGFIADREGAFGWTAPSEEQFRFHIAQTREVGGHLCGRRLYETMLVWETDPSMRDNELGAAFGRFEHFDARAGGSYRLVLTYADASAARGKSAADSDVVDARFVEIAPGVRVVQQIEFVSEDPAFDGTMTMTWEVTPVDARSRVDIRADDVPDGINAADHAAGLSSSLDNLAAYVQR